MSASPKDFREQLRAASEALAQAELKAAGGGNPYAARGVSDAQFKQVKQRLLSTARESLARASEAALRSAPPAGLPGLPQGKMIAAATDMAPGERALATVWSSVAELATLRGDKDTSITAYRKTLEFAPSDLIAHAQLADLLESRHDVAGAKAHAHGALRLDASNFTAALALARAEMREGRFAEAERAAMIAAKAPRAAADDRALALSLVGEARDRSGKPAEAFKAFNQANALMLQRYRALQDAPHPAHPANVRALTQFVTQADPEIWRGPASFTTPAPAFLIGFPRSGTTLAEQILASHAKITCLGETEYLVVAMSTVLRDGDMLGRLRTLTSAEIEGVRATYRKLVFADCPGAKDHLIVDKHPLHITILPLINKFFPDAKIIFTQRDPRDVVLSCYQQSFGMNVATARFLELDKTADYYDAVMQLMLTCRERLKLDLLQVEYRDIVAGLESEARRMAEFLNLPFDTSMLRYDETARTRVISSASARQVINPIYDRSVTRWRRYARELAPVLPVLNEWARRLGYED
jgi:tetratricopeptide (TPR) repeat protein